MKNKKYFVYHLNNDKLKLKAVLDTRKEVEYFVETYKSNINRDGLFHVSEELIFNN